MQRRKFLVGVGGTAIGGSALLGSGAFSRVESQRSVDIKIAHDEYAYLGILQTDDPNSSYTGYDDKGHFFIQMDEDNPNLPDEETGIGVNSNSLSFFDDLFSVRNQGKQAVTFCIDTSGMEVEPNVDTSGDPTEDAEDVVIFYKGNAKGSQGLGGITPIACPDTEGSGHCWDEFDAMGTEAHTHRLQVGEELQVGLLVCTKDSSLGHSSRLTGEARLLADASMEADQNLPLQGETGTGWSDTSFEKAYGQEALYGSSSRDLNQTPHEVKIHPALANADTSGDTEARHDFNPDDDEQVNRTVPFEATFDDDNGGYARFEIDGVEVYDSDIEASSNGENPQKPDDPADIAVTVRAGDAGAGHDGDLSRVDNLEINGLPVVPGSIETENEIEFIEVTDVDHDGEITITGDWTFEVDEDEFDTSGFKDVPGLGIDLR